MKKKFVNDSGGISMSFMKQNLLKMKLTFLFLFLSFVQLMANDGYSQSTRVTLNLKDARVEDVLMKIEEQSNLYFIYNRDVVDVNRIVNVSCTNQKVTEILDGIFTGTDIDYEIQNRHIILKSSFVQISQPKTVSGKVTDSSGLPLIGVTVVVKGTTTGIITVDNGSYSLPNVPADATLVFSFVGMKTQEISVSGKTIINVVLTEETIGIDEVVAIGYGTMKKSDLIGALSIVPSKEYAEQNITRLDQALQGRVAGLQVTNIEGSPGGDVKIRIRGANSILGDNNPLFVIDGFVGANFSMLNPSDIESIQVLKDASATAIYGSRGSNGVIIITTKNGNKGTVKIEYQGQASLSNVIYKYDLLNAGDFAKIVNERNKSLDLNPAFTQQQIDSYYATGGTDWQDAVYRTAYSNDHQLSISGGSEKTTFHISANALNQEGIIKNSGFKRYILRSNITTSLNDRLFFRINIAGASMSNLNTNAGYATNNPVVQSIAWAPTTPMYDDKGNYTMNDPIGSIKYNPMALIYDRENKVERSFGNVVGGLRYEFTKGLSFDIQLAIDYMNKQTKVFTGNYVSTFNPSASKASGQDVTLQNTNTLSYKRNFNEKHNIDAVAVFETQRYTGEGFNANASSLKFPELGYDNLAMASSYTISSYYTKWTLMSFLGRFNYSFRNKYILSASIRRDGSSKFQTNNKWSTFPSFAAGWNLANEKFIQNLNVFNNLKMRASWGLTGSQAIQPYATESTYNTDVIAAFNNSSVANGIQIGNPGNANLKWETTEQIDVGTEIGLFNGRLIAEIDYFKKNTKDLLLNRPLPSYAGGGSIASNIGEIENNGWEFLIGGTIFNRGSFNWTSYFNISTVKNTVVSLGGIAERIFTGTNTSGIASQSEFVYEPGKPLGSYWGLKYLGTWKPDEAEEAALSGNVPGDARYEKDYQIIGCGMPKTSTGWNNTITYKNLTINIFFQGILGVDKLNLLRGAALMGARDNRQATLEDIKDRYIPGVNEKSNIPAFSKTSNIIPQSTMFMEDGSFIRLKNLSLSYDIPTQRISKIDKIKVFMNATNLLTFTKYKGVDAEASSVSNSSDLTQSVDFGAYPNSKTFTIGLNFSF